ncbi:MAG: plastocyanin/azurin family copper-binding protein [Planctomycetota bacterium]
MFARLLSTLTALALLAPFGAAQTTTTVQLFSSSFAPKDINIEVGDTVRWTWVTGAHNVVSGDSGMPDGIFASLLTSAPFTFEVTFDQAFLDANPVPGNRYDYYCIVHLPGMVGSVTVNVPSVADVIPYGTAVNPSGSLLTNINNPQTGGQIGFRLANPLDPTAGPGIGTLFISSAPTSLVLPGFGLSPNVNGELLVSLTAPNPLISLGPTTWDEGGSVDFFLDIPFNPALVGVSVYVQGALVDTTSASPFGVTNGVELIIG